MRRLLDHNPLTGESVIFEYEAGSDKDTLRITHEQDVSALLDGNKRLANDRDITKKGIKNDMWHYASIPNALILKWKEELGVDVFDKNDRKKVFKLLNSPEYKYLKTTDLTHGG